MPPKGAAASVVVHHVWREAPIVVGRGVSLHHKTKLHHVKDKPLDSNENYKRGLSGRKVAQT